MGSVNPHQRYIFPFIPEGPYDGYIFDCDGTLAHSMPMHFNAWKQALKMHNARFEFTWEIFHALAGMGLKETIETLNERFNESLDPATLLIDHEAIVDQEIVNVKGNPGVVAMAQKLGLDPSAYLVFEDSELGVEAAVNANMDYVLIPEDLPR